MSLIEETLEGTINRIDIAIERLKCFEPPEGYYLAFSGGKDSIVLYKLAEISGVKFDAHFNLTTVDPPELLRFIKEFYPEIEWHKPEKSMFSLIEEEGIPPTAIMRYCCKYLKERGGIGRIVLTGIRGEESIRRKSRKIVENCIRFKTKSFVNPIIDWSSGDVWDFIKKKKLKYCSLYDEGYKRIGCIMCPMMTIKDRLRDKNRYPKFYKAYLLAFKKMLERRKIKGKTNSWKTPEDVMNWWIYKQSKQKQDTLFN